jgi:hypothetical protein
MSTKRRKSKNYVRNNFILFFKFMGGKEVETLDMSR